MRGMRWQVSLCDASWRGVVHGVVAWRRGIVEAWHRGVASWRGIVAWHCCVACLDRDGIVEPQQIVL